MYANYARLMGFRWEELEFQEDNAIARGCKKGVFKVTGQDVYKYLKHESGAHKV